MSSITLPVSRDRTCNFLIGSPNIGEALTSDGNKHSKPALRAKSSISVIHVESLNTSTVAGCNNGTTTPCSRSLNDAHELIQRKIPKSGALNAGAENTNTSASKAAKLALSAIIGSPIKRNRHHENEKSSSCQKYSTK
ncbi:MAG: hypothetical protein RI897_4669 [Verrucomicrobiota bacterium]|jgi:hypothetical protein